MARRGFIEGQPIRWSTSSEVSCIAIVATVPRDGEDVTFALGISHEDMQVPERWPRLLRAGIKCLERSFEMEDGPGV